MKLGNGIERNSNVENVWSMTLSGKMNPCENDYKSYLKIGNFNENSIKEAWNSEFYKKLREDHISKKRNKHTPCDRCTVV